MIKIGDEITVPCGKETRQVVVTAATEQDVFGKYVKPEVSYMKFHLRTKDFIEKIGEIEVVKQPPSILSEIKNDREFYHLWNVLKGRKYAYTGKTVLDFWINYINLGYNKLEKKRYGAVDRYYLINDNLNQEIQISGDERKFVTKYLELINKSGFEKLLNDIGIIL